VRAVTARGRIKFRITLLEIFENSFMEPAFPKAIAVLKNFQISRELRSVDPQLLEFSSA